MKADVEIVLGGALSGKTQTLLSRYREELKRSTATGQPGRTLWLSTTSRACRQILDTLLDDSLPASFAPNVFTFESFAERILQHAPLDWVSLSPVKKRLLLRHLIDDLRQEGRLGYFSSIAGTSGFLDLVLSLISELKRDEIWPEQFEASCRKRGARNKDLELALIYGRYQEQLIANHSYDAEGRFWSARDALRQGHWGPFGDLSLVVVDGFTDFTHTQYEILGCLADSAKKMLIALSLEQPLKRTNLFAKSSVALERIQHSIAPPVRLPVQKPSQTDVPPCPALRHIAEHLFSDPDEVPTSANTEGIKILAVAGKQREVMALAEQVKQLLLTGTAADDIIVAFRPLDDYADLVEETFSAAGLPFSSAAAEPAARAPILKALMRVLMLEQEDWPFERLVAVLDSSYFQPEWAGTNKARSVRAVASELRRLKLHRGRQQILRAFDRECAAKDASGKRAPDGSDFEAAPSAVTKRAQAMLARLSSATERLRRQEDFATWAQIVVSLARELGMIPRSVKKGGTDDPLTARDRATWEIFVRLLFEAQSVQTLFAAPRSMDLAQFIDVLQDLLDTERIAPPAQEYGTVRVLDADQVRNLDVPHLFLAGLTETSFPGRREDDCLYGELDRLELNQHGLRLGHRTSRSQDEMLLFYGVVTRARRSLVLSYPNVTPAGGPLYPSPYLYAIRTLFEPGALEDIPVGSLSPVPESQQVLTPAQLRIAATANVRKKQAGLFRTMIQDEAYESTSRNILASAWLNAHRFHTRGFTKCEGMLSSPATRGRLQKRYPTEHEFSATHLEQYAHCPFQFFLERVLRLKAHEDPEPNTDHLLRGTIVHRLLAQAHAGRDGAQAETSEDEIVRRFKDGVKAFFEDHPAHSDLHAALLRLDRRQMLDWADEYGSQLTQYYEKLAAWKDKPAANCRELDFGRAHGVESEEQPRFGYLTFGTGARETRVCGRIDRIDVGKIGSKTVYNIIDYKTGKAKTFGAEEVEAGHAIQLSLYMLAVRRLEILGSDAVPFQMGYWALKEQGFQPGLQESKHTKSKELPTFGPGTVEQLSTALETVIPEFAEGIRSGTFPVYSSDENCTRLCDYSTVCRVNQIRPLEEKLDKRPHRSTDK